MNSYQKVQRPLLNFKASKDKAKDRRKSSSNDQNYRLHLVYTVFYLLSIVAIELMHVSITTQPILYITVLHTSHILVNYKYISSQLSCTLYVWILQSFELYASQITNYCFNTNCFFVVRQRVHGELSLSIKISEQEVKSDLV